MSTTTTTNASVTDILKPTLTISFFLANNGLLMVINGHILNFWLMVSECQNVVLVTLNRWNRPLTSTWLSSQMAGKFLQKKTCEWRVVSWKTRVWREYMTVTCDMCSDMCHMQRVLCLMFTFLDDCIFWQSMQVSSEGLESFCGQGHRDTRIDERCSGNKGFI